MDTEENKRKVRVIAIGVDKSDDEAKERGVPREADWEEAAKTAKRGIIPPPFNMWGLTLFRENNSELGQCIDAMCVNICGFGHQIIDPLGRTSSDTPPEVESEWEALDELIRHGDFDGQSHDEVKKLLRGDKEATGNDYLELVETRDGRIIGYNHIPAYQMRLTIRDKKLTTYTDTRVVGRGEKRRTKKVKRRKRFRRYVQLTKHKGEINVVYFKELGDPRAIDAKTGQPLTPAQLADGKQTIANPMLHTCIATARSPYGIPRYIGNLLAIMGGRAAERINFTTIKNNNIPSMLMLVSNGQLTDGTIKRIKDFTKTVIEDSENRSRFLIVEAEPDGDGEGGQVKIEAKPLAQLQTDDAMFKNYETGNQNKVRRSFRLPEVLVGMAGEYTANNVDSSKRIADEQVFAPERRQDNWNWNRILLYNGARFHEYKANGPNVTNDKDLIEVMKGAERSGAMTPRRATMILEDLIGTRVAPMSEEVDLDVPFSQQMAESVKNQAAPNEPGQQSTALKSVGAYQTLDGLLTATVEVMKGNRPTLPAIQLDTADAVLVQKGKIIELDLNDDMSDVPHYIVDQSNVYAICKLVDQGNSEYILEDVLPLSGTYVSQGDVDGKVHADVLAV